MAAAISYYALFSMFPLMLFWVGVFGLVLQNRHLQQDLVDAVLNYLPLSEDKGRNQVTDAVRAIAGPESSAFSVFGLLGLAWSGSSMFGVIRRSLNTTLGIESRSPVLRRKAADLLMVLAIGLFFGASIAGTAVLRVAQSASAPFLGGLADSLGFGWSLAAFLLPLLLSFAAFFVLYFIVPAKRMRVVEVWPGALLAALVFELSKTAFAIYVENFSSFDLVFGSLGAVMAFLFWVYLSANVLLIGAEVVSAYPDAAFGQLPLPAGPPTPLPARLGRLLLSMVVHGREEVEKVSGHRR